MRESIKTYTRGTDRVVPPKETLKKVAKHYKSFGITRVANITGLDHIGIPVALACRPNSRALAVSQGKGLSFEAAAASAVMESIEGFHAERIFQPKKVMSYKDLSQYKNIINIKKLARLQSSSFNENTRITWVRGTDLYSNEEIYIPYETIHTDYTEPWPEDHGHFIADSNGLASGNTICEAVNHALYEVIERDALALWSLMDDKSKNARKVILDTIKNQDIDFLITLIKDAGIGIALWDITTDIELPTYICKIMPECSHQELRIRPAYGSGTHINPYIAMSRAITEAAQSRLTFIAGARDDQYQSIYNAQVSDKIYQKWYKEIFFEKEELRFERFSYPHNEYMEDDQKHVLALLKSIGIKQIGFVNLTRPTFDIPVVKIVIPSLEGISFPGERLLGQRGQSVYKKYGVGACKKIS